MIQDADSISHLLASWTSRVPTRVGIEIGIRPLRADDREREIDFIMSLSERTRYMRLFAPLKFLSPHLLDQLMNIDYSRSMAFVATIEQDGGERFIGLARYGETDEPGVVELGVTVTDEWQRRGIARLLMSELMRFADWRGVRRIVGSVLPENYAMLALARRLGFTVSYDPAARLMQISHELRHGSQGMPAGISAAGAGDASTRRPVAEHF
jgi:acetyltransferase